MQKFLKGKADESRRDKKVVLGEKLTIEEFMQWHVFHAEVEFSEAYRERVENPGRSLRHV